MHQWTTPGIALTLLLMGVAPSAAVSVDVPPLECGLVTINTDASGNSNAAGFVATEDDLAAVQNALSGKVETTNVELAPWPACEIRVTLSSGLAASDGPTATIAPVSPSVGDVLAVEIETPAYESYLHAAYFAADGSVFALVQPDSGDLRAKSAHSVLRFGDDGPGLAFIVTEPAGQEMLLVIASEKPLFAASRPDVEASEDFLSALRQTVLTGEAGRITATLVPILTRP